MSRNDELFSGSAVHSNTPDRNLVALQTRTHCTQLQHYQNGDGTLCQFGPAVCLLPAQRTEHLSTDIHLTMFLCSV